MGEQAPGMSGPSGDPGGPDKVCVLLVDDVKSNLLLLESALERDYRLLTATSGEQALRIATAQPPDLVLLDVMMPKKSGFDVLQAVREHDELAAIRILMLTAKGRDTDMAKGLALGADDYMTKPFSTRELVDKVRALLGAGA